MFVAPSIDEAWTKLRSLCRTRNWDEGSFVLAKSGEDNYTFLGRGVAVRIVRYQRENPLPEFEVAQKAKALGIRTAQALEWGEGWSIWERLDGIDAWSFGDLSRVDWTGLIEDLQILHAHPIGNPRDVEWESFDLQSFERLLSDPMLESCREDIIELARPPNPIRHTYIHGDAHGGNVIVDQNGAYVGLIDWGDSDWGPTDVEWAHLEPPALDRLLQMGDAQIDFETLSRYKLMRALRLAQGGFWTIQGVFDSYQSILRFRS